jgi:hypothetical protein
VNITATIEQLEVGDSATFHDYEQAASIRVLCNRVMKRYPGKKFITRTLTLPELKLKSLEVERTV